MIDHLVLATPDVSSTADALRREWGVDVLPGGSHLGRGTRNELVNLGNGAYLEIVGPDAGQAAPPFARPFGVDDIDEPRLVAWCARPAMPIDEAAEAIDMLGFSRGAVSAMSRLRPDGVLLEWLLTAPMVGHPHEGTVPFLIDWLASPHPTASLPRQCTLQSLRLSHPRAHLLRAVMAELGIDNRVSVDEGPAGMTAVVITPLGNFTL
jgi:hypothetical protein